MRSLYLARARATRVHLITPGLYSRVLREKCGCGEESGEGRAKAGVKPVEQSLARQEGCVRRGAACERARARTLRNG